MTSPETQKRIACIREDEQHISHRYIDFEAEQKDENFLSVMVYLLPSHHEKELVQSPSRLVRVVGATRRC